MGFLGNPLKKIGGALSKLPGAKTLNKPMNKLMGQTPGLKGVPQKLGMAGPKKSPIAPTPGAMPNLMQGGIQAAGNAGIVGGPKPPMDMKNAMQGAPTMGAPMAQPEMPEAVPGMMDQQQPSLGPWNPDPNSVPPELQQQAATWQGTPQPMPQRMPQVPQQQMGNIMDKLRQRNTGVTGGRMGPIAQKNGLGPSYMG